MSELYLISTPIGNLDDITLRAVKTLFSVDILLCEDTRRTGNLVSRLQGNSDISSLLQNSKKPRFVSFHEHNNEKRIPEVLKYLSWGKSVGLVSNAGSPLISDPGYKLVNACIDKGYNVVPIPGPSAVIAASAVSGFTTARILFVGFLSKRTGKKKKLLIKVLNAAQKLDEILSIVFFESPYRLKESLELVEEVFSDPEVAVCVELTKLYEEVLRGKASELCAALNDKKIKGEVTVVVEFSC